MKRDEMNEEEKEEKELKIEEPKETEKEKQKKILKELCKRILIPLLSVLSRTYKNLNFKEILNVNETKDLLDDIFKEKKIIITENMFKNVFNILNTN